MLFTTFFINYELSSQELPDSLQSDNLKIIDSTEIDKPVEVIDTIPPTNPLQSHGSMFILPEKFRNSITKQDIQFVNYATFADIFKRKIKAYPLFLGSYGQFNSFSMFGGMPQNLSVSFNGRPVGDFAFSNLNLSQISPEFMESAEILTGTDAITFSNDASGALINIQEVQYNTKYPYTKFWLSEANFDFISSDGVFSQNFAKNWNFTFGFRNMSSVGRYENSWVESWNVRALLRWNPSDRTSISLVEYFTNQGFATTGGIENTGDDYCDDLLAFPIYSQVKERVFRHDLTLTLSSILDADSSQAIHSSIYFSNSEWERRRSLDMIFNQSDSSLYYGNTSIYVGANARYENNLLDFTKFTLGGELRYISLEATDYLESFSGISAAAFSQLKIFLSNDFVLTGGLRLKAQHEKYAASLGGKIDYSLSDDILLTGDISYSERFPSPSEGLSLDNEKNLLGLFKFEWQNNENQLSLTAFGRHVLSPVMAKPIYNENGTIINTESYNGDSRFVVGSILEAETTILEALLINSDRIVISGWANIQFNISDDSTSKRFPIFYGGMETYYELEIGRSLARLGFSFELLSSFKGEYFFPITRAYIPYNYEKGFSTNGAKVFAIARLGSNAYVKLSFENPLSQCYYYVPIYPMDEMNFKLSVSWSFMD